MHNPLPIKLNISSQRACHCLPFLLPGNSGVPFPVCQEVPLPHLGNGSRKETAGAESGRAVELSLSLGISETTLEWDWDCIRIPNV